MMNLFKRISPLTFTILFGSFCLLLLTTTSTQAQTDIRGDVLPVDKDLYNDLSEWAAQGAKQQVPLDVFLTERFGHQKTSNFLTKFYKRPYSPSMTRAGCECAVVIPNTIHDLSPSELTEETDNDSGGTFYHWDRTYNLKRFGAAYSSVLDFSGWSTFNPSSTHEYSRITSGSANASATNTRIELNWICTTDNYPSDCGCDKTIDFRGKYESSLSVSTEVGGPYNKMAIASAEDFAAFITYDWAATSTDLINNAEIIGGEHVLLYDAESHDWNPEAFVNLTNLGLTIATFGLAASGSDTANINPSDYPQLGEQIGDVLSTPFIIYNDSVPNGNDNQLILHKDYQMTLKPNIKKTIGLISNGRVMGEGKGAVWEASASIISSYSMTVVIPFDDSNTDCCIERIAAWDLKGFGGAPNTNISLLEGIKNFLNLEHQPDVNWGPNPITGSMDLELYSTGYINNVLKASEGLSVSDSCPEHDGSDDGDDGDDGNTGNNGGTSGTPNSGGEPADTAYCFPNYGRIAQYPSLACSGELVELSIASPNRLYNYLWKDSKGKVIGKGTSISVFPDTYSLEVSKRLILTHTADTGGGEEEAPAPSCRSHQGYTVKVDEACAIKNPGKTTSTSIDANIKLYPNPASDRLYIQYTTTDLSSKLSIYDLTGRLVQQQNLVANQSIHTIDVHTLQSGMYIARIVTEEGEAYVRRVMIVD